MYIQKDPLLAYEQKKSHPSLLSSLGKTMRFLTMYFALTGMIFVVLLGVLNFSAYSSRILYWIDPETLLSAREEVTGLLSSSSVEVHASETANTETREDRETITEKIIASNPEIVYSQNYGPKGLISHLPQTSLEASFDVTPYENRIVIPRIGKNIPLVDVTIHSGASFETMHEVFMEELKKGVVRYPGTAEPGERGNVFIFGHSSNYPWIKSDYNDVFALLDTLQNGDEITIYYFQKKYVYKVTDRAIVKPGDVKTLESRDHTKKELSIMTCWPIGTTLERIILFAELVEEK